MNNRIKLAHHSRQMRDKRNKTWMTVSYDSDQIQISNHCQI